MDRFSRFTREANHTMLLAKFRLILLGVRFASGVGRYPRNWDSCSGARLCENLTDAMFPLLNRGMMKGFVQGADRQQTTLLPECLDDWVDESNPVRAVDVFVDALELRELGFDGVDPAATGRPGYHPSPLLKLYIYGYLNRTNRAGGLSVRLAAISK